MPILPTNCCSTALYCSRQQVGWQYFSQRRTISLPCKKIWNVLPSTLKHKEHRSRPKGPCTLCTRLGKPFLSQLQKRTAENPLTSASRESWSWFGRTGWSLGYIYWYLGQPLQCTGCLEAAGSGEHLPQEPCWCAHLLHTCAVHCARNCSSPTTSSLPVPWTQAELARA